MEITATSMASTPGTKKLRLSRLGLNQARATSVTGSASRRRPALRAKRCSMRARLKSAAMREA